MTYQLGRSGPPAGRVLMVGGQKFSLWLAAYRLEQYVLPGCQKFRLDRIRPPWPAFSWQAAENLGRGLQAWSGPSCYALADENLGCGFAAYQRIGPTPAPGLRFRGRQLKI